MNQQNCGIYIEILKRKFHEETYCKKRLAAQKRVSGDSLETQWKLCVFTKFLHQEIR